MRTRASEQLLQSSKSAGRTGPVGNGTTRSLFSRLLKPLLFPEQRCIASHLSREFDSARNPRALLNT